MLATVAVSGWGGAGAGAGRRCEDGEVIVRLRIPPPVTSHQQSGDSLTLPLFIHRLSLKQKV